MRATRNKSWLLSTVALGALSVTASSALAGGFEVREQSAFFQGTSFAGTAAGGSSLSSIFWNPATSYIAKDGITTDSNYSLVLPEMNVHADEQGIPGVPPGAPIDASLIGDTDVDLGRDALVPASYAAYRINDKLVAALAMNSQYGLTTKPDNMGWSGNYLAQTSKIFSLNLNPSLSYQIMPGVVVGAGLQVQYFELKTLRTTAYNGNDADDIGVGGTAGINITPFRGSSIGLGYRSRIKHEIDGDFDVVDPANPLVSSGDLSAKLDTPDKVTLSIRQDLGPTARLFGTVEWTNWSEIGVVPVSIPQNFILPAFGVNQAALNANWEDGWLYAIGGEFDYSNKISLRAGIAYEESPIQDDTSRLIQLPDNNRVWASVGATYNWSDTTKINMAYSHVWVEDGDIERDSLLGPAGGTFSGSAEDNGADIISVGVTTKLDWLLGGRHADAAPLK
ncbi:MAG: outer membrane protein transport protein [Hyphomicrobiaceae bacterium]|nr:outer membrane protein transport protein [Hyphomicrobiaceae bacterium]